MIANRGPTGRRTRGTQSGNRGEAGAFGCVRAGSKIPACQNISPAQPRRRRKRARDRRQVGVGHIIRRDQAQDNLTFSFHVVLEGGLTKLRPTHEPRDIVLWIRLELVNGSRSAPQTDREPLSGV